MNTKAAKSNSKTNDLFARLIRGDWSIFRKSRSGTSGGDETLDLGSIGEALLSRRGEASGTMLAQRLLDNFEHSTREAQLEFFLKLAEGFGVATDKFQEAMLGYQQSPSDEMLLRLYKATEPRRQELIRRMNYSSGGTHRLIKMRETLLSFIDEHPELAAVDSDFLHLFISWFNPGFLEMRPMDWSTPANILERLIKYEAVHAIQDWNDLRNRLDPADRRCFGFFHPQLAEEPLIFVEVALTTDIPTSIQKLLHAERTPTQASHATTAVFYSISNTQKGLAGVPFGSFLLKQVIEYLQHQVPNLNTFVTLSPVPGFARWLDKERADAQSELLTEAIREPLNRLEAADWHTDKEKAASVRTALLESARAYFLLARSSRGTVVDPVARFHLRNGAELHHLNFLGDISEKGLRQSCGLMVNYLYRPSDIERNHEAFVERSEIVVSRAVTGKL
ncbi:malonyl-CoA decarboxylase [Allopusillimonas ginsengisoli]|uniref:malonyl-CoA decarboxylase n=1 Tax=Allopusillimonas ginsengisoli TaxID=453575 RepID=UPI00101ED727|nr:malonyl-CoA decarboxylase [Allopusillimonas ginsengisoli]TEA69452.1 MCD, Malonyl-CoA decarboxylase MCD [Allopusillimonas ginsengisoli]